MIFPGPNARRCYELCWWCALFWINLKKIFYWSFIKAYETVKQLILSPVFLSIRLNVLLMVNHLSKSLL